MAPGAQAGCKSRRDPQGVSTLALPWASWAWKLCSPLRGPVAPLSWPPQHLPSAPRGPPAPRRGHSRLSHEVGEVLTHPCPPRPCGQLPRAQAPSECKSHQQPEASGDLPEFLRLGTSEAPLSCHRVGGVAGAAGGDGTGGDSGRDRAMTGGSRCWGCSSGPCPPFWKAHMLASGSAWEGAGAHQGANGRN